ncbi:hypothetical protein HXX76_006742 [Chlamydomonas incerta]|uniref:Protein kinase domain-containing protein n=1 Tax=Chlamydomonas incerta TaxID=51695 RepID=A0A835W462_CHLIN|nr:hypothetical protein HXX76_006742 [Chlamydomonas incerta]|eukprot:KAG2436439.1 hypothetical protein HXX76_006742 [Chlamydomonas incerta]
MVWQPLRRSPVVMLRALYLSTELERGGFFDGPDPATGMQTLISALDPAEPLTHARRHTGVAAPGAGLTESVSDAGPPGLGIQHAQLSPGLLMNPRTLSTGGVRFASRSLHDSSDTPDGVDGGGGHAVSPAAALPAAACTAGPASSSAAATPCTAEHPGTTCGIDSGKPADGSAAAHGAQQQLQAKSALQQQAAATTTAAPCAVVGGPAGGGGDEPGGAVSSSAAATALGSSPRPSAFTSTSTGGGATTLRTLMSRAASQHHFYASPFATPSRQELHSCSASLTPQIAPPQQGTAAHGLFERRSAAMPLACGGSGGGGGRAASAAASSDARRLLHGFASEARAPSALAPPSAESAAGAGAPTLMPAAGGSVPAGGVLYAEVVNCDSSSSRLRQLPRSQHQPQPQPQPQPHSQQQSQQYAQHAQQHQQPAACRSPAASAIISGIMPRILSRNASVCVPTSAAGGGGGGSFAMAAAATAAMCHSRLTDSPGSFDASPGMANYVVSATGSRLLSPAAVVAAAAAAGRPQPAGSGSTQTLTRAEVALAEANAVVMSACLPDYSTGGGHRQSSSSCRSGASGTSGASGSDVARGRNPSFVSTANVTALAPPSAAQAAATAAAAAAAAAPSSAALYVSPPVCAAAASGASGAFPNPGARGGAAGGGAKLAPLPEMLPSPPAYAPHMCMYTSAAKLLAPPPLPAGLLLGGVSATHKPVPVSVNSPLTLADTADTAAALFSGGAASSVHDRAHAALVSMHGSSNLLRLDHSLQLGTGGSAFASTSGGDITVAAAAAAPSRPPTTGKALSIRNLRPATASVCALPESQAAARPAVRLASSADVWGPGVQLPWHIAAQPQQLGSESTRELLPPSALPSHLQLSSLQHSLSSQRLCGQEASSPSSQQPLPTAAAATPNAADTILRITDLDTCWAELRDLAFLGSGACGNVYTGTWCGMPVAAKFMISGSEDQLQRQQREAALSRLASHPHLVQTYAIATAQLLPVHFRSEYGGGGGGGGSSGAHAARFSGLLSQAGDLLGTVCGTDGTDLYGTNPYNASSSNHQHPHIAAAVVLSRCTSNMRATAGASGGTSGGVLSATPVPLTAQQLMAGAHASGGQQQQQHQQSRTRTGGFAAKPITSPFAQSAAAAHGASLSSSRSSSSRSSSAGEACGASGSSSRRITAMLAGGGGAAGAQPSPDTDETQTVSGRRGTAIGIEIAARRDFATADGSADSGVEMFSASSLAEAVGAARVNTTLGFRGFELGAAGAPPTATPAAGNSPTKRPRQQAAQQQLPHTTLLSGGGDGGTHGRHSQPQYPAAEEYASSIPTAAAAAGIYAFTGSNRSASSHGSQQQALPASAGAPHRTGAGTIHTAAGTRPRATAAGSGAYRGGGLSAAEPGSEESQGSRGNPKACTAGSSSSRCGAPQRRSMQINTAAAGGAGSSLHQQHEVGAAAGDGNEHLTTIAISTVDTDVLEAASQRPREILPGNIGSRGRGGDGAAACGGGGPDSFELGTLVSHEALVTLQPSDVLAHIGARPGQWLTVVIMEEMDRGSLHRAIHGGIFDATASHLIKRHRVRGMVRTLVEVAQGMAALHASGLVHGDLKPANVLLKAQTRDARGFVAKVSDFGSTRVMLEGASAATVTTNDWGTVIYTAPEVFNGRSGPPSDVYSFGALTWHLTTGQLPHEDLNPFAVLLAVSKGELELEWPSSVAKPLRRLGQLCMQHDPATRPTFAVIARALLKLEQRMKTQSAGAAAAKRSEAGVGGGRA